MSNELLPKDLNTLKTVRRVMMEFKDFCAEQAGPKGGRCSEYGAECPIQMGEWWTAFEEETLQDLTALIEHT